MTDTPRRVLSLKREAGVSTPRIEERLHKVLAQAGLGSRRALEERIARGEIQVNGAVAATGSSLTNGDRVDLDGRSFVATALSDPPRMLIYNKPEGELTTRDDPEGRPTIFDNLPRLKGSRWIAIGRLDINTTGLMLLTTDGDIANALMHPSGEVQREYVCRIHGEVSEDVLKQLKRGVMLEDGEARFDEIEPIGASDSHGWFRVVLREGRNREVRRMWEAVGFQVSRLKRVRYGNITLPRLLRRGQTQELPVEQVATLRQGLKLAAVESSLTLEPVIHQRRARATEYKPAHREQRAWTGAAQADEARELRAFDNLRDDAGPGRGRRGRPGGGKPGSGKPAAGARPPRKGAPANKRRSGGPASPPALTAPGGQPRGRSSQPRGAAPGFDNSGEFRSWYVPEGVTTTSRIGAPGDKPKGPRPPRGKPPGGRPGNPGNSRSEGRNAGPAARGNSGGPGGNSGTPRPAKRPGGPRKGGGPRGGGGGGASGNRSG
jgi:23S rRNA pseudouridine2605 synthase